MLCVIHDCYYDKYGVSLTGEECEKKLLTVPDNILYLAGEWGEFDTEVREKLYEFL